MFAAKIKNQWQVAGFGYPAEACYLFIKNSDYYCSGSRT